MVKSCMYPGCGHRTNAARTIAARAAGETIRFHRFPVKPARRAVWIAALRMPEDFKPTRDHYVCSQHFVPGVVPPELLETAHLTKHEGGHGAAVDGLTPLDLALAAAPALGLANGDAGSSTGVDGHDAAGAATELKQRRARKPRVMRKADQQAAELPGAEGEDAGPLPADLPTALDEIVRLRKELAELRAQLARPRGRPRGPRTLVTPDDGTGAPDTAASAVLDAAVASS